VQDNSDLRLACSRKGFENAISKSNKITSFQKGFSSEFRFGLGDEHDEMEVCNQLYTGVSKIRRLPNAIPSGWSEIFHRKKYSGRGIL